MTGHCRDDGCVEADSLGTQLPERRGAAQTAWRRGRAVELAIAGLSYDDIAEQVGYANRGTAWRTVQEAFRDRRHAAIDEHRALELARLDSLHSAYWDAAITGDLKAAEVCLKVIAQRIKLL